MGGTAGGARPDRLAAEGPRRCDDRAGRRSIADRTAGRSLVRAAGGAPIGAYREPLGGRTLLLASLPCAAVQPTPFQRDLSPTHAKRLAKAIEEQTAKLPSDTFLTTLESQ